MAGARGLVLLEKRLPSGVGDCPNAGEVCNTLAAVSMTAEGDGSVSLAAFGDLVWTSTLPVQVLSAYTRACSRSGDVNVMARVMPGEPVELIDPTTGSVTAALPAGTGVPLLTSTHLVALTQEAGQTVVTGHAWSPAVSGWKAVLAMPAMVAESETEPAHGETQLSGESAVDSSSELGLRHCGSLVCAFASTESGDRLTYVLEPATGRLMATLTVNHVDDVLSDDFYLARAGYPDSWPPEYVVLRADGTLASSLPAGARPVRGDSGQDSIYVPTNSDDLMLVYHSSETE